MPAPGAGVLERLNAAMNAHDLEALLDCFREDYDSEQPAHPDRGFGGTEQVRANWGAIFAGVPDFKSELLRTAVGPTRRGANGAGAEPRPAARRSTWRE